MTKKQVGEERVYSAYTSILLFITKESQDWNSSRSESIVLPEDPAIPLLVIYLEDVPSGNKDTCSTMFFAALFIIARIWKELRCPSAEEWIQKCDNI